MTKTILTIKNHTHKSGGNSIAVTSRHNSRTSPAHKGFNVKQYIAAKTMGMPDNKGTDMAHAMRRAVHK